MTRRLHLTEAERHATLWAVSASRAVLDRANRAGRSDTAVIAQQAPTVDDLNAALDADVLHEADIPPVLAALRFASSLHRNDMAEIREVLKPPPLADMTAAIKKIEALPAVPRTAQEQA